MLVSEFDYELPGELIAQQPAPACTSSRLLRLDAGSGAITDLAFTDLPGLVGPRDAVVLNDTRVVRARLAARKRTGGKIEVFVERPLGAREALALIRASHALHAGAEILLGDGAIATVLGREEDLYRLRFSHDVPALLERLGAVPLPPYIRHEPDAKDAERYQTVYASTPGAVAAPTAGLHFDQDMLAKIEKRGASVVRLTLHVGAGTFQPVRAEQIEDHRMHKERYAIPPDAPRSLAGRKILAVGTTVLRTLETHALTGQLQGETDLFVYPGFQFMAVDRLLTNFHLPKSTLLMLACAFGGKENVMRAYRHAIDERYRFFSYGDAMLIEK